jgi:Uma2 family endonuclease
MSISVNREIIYPESDGQPMADNTKQFRWIVLIKENLEILFANDPEIFVAGDLLWYPVEGHPEIRVAPDVMVVLGRPKGDRGSYRQWEENDIAPQVVFEILSLGNRLREMTRKWNFYNRYGVEEYYIYDPDDNEFQAMQRQDGYLRAVEETESWVSRKLGIKFVLTSDVLEIYRPDHRKFLSSIELEKRAEKLAAKLRALGVDPEA